jgi:cell division protein FtsB
LRNNKEEVEKVAREELGLVRKGEIVYQFEK